MPQQHKTWETIAILGVGLMGGSIVMAVRERGLATRVVGIGRLQASLNKAKRHGAVDFGTTSIQRGVADADLIIVCTPVERIVDHVCEAAAFCPADALITDAGSTKEAIVQELSDWPGFPALFVGSHPLAGSEKTGCENGDADLFVDRVCVITPSRKTRDHEYESIAQFWASIGMRTIRMSPKAHDKALASTSHLPHVVAAALASATAEKHLPLVAGGWLDTTRIAAADESLWRQILLENRNNTLQSIDAFQTSLDALRKAIAENDGPKVERLMRKGRQRREAAE